jgi:hypothetical protein
MGGAGNNSITVLEDNVMYLRQFKELRLVNLAGNPICSNPEYKSFVLSHISNLTYLDYRRVNPNDVQAAQEQHQDEMTEINEKEEQDKVVERAEDEKTKHEVLMKEANLDGVEGLVEDMLKDDPEYKKLKQVPGLMDPLTDFQDRFNMAAEEFRVSVLPLKYL